MLSLNGTAPAALMVRCLYCFDLNAIGALLRYGPAFNLYITKDPVLDSGERLLLEMMTELVPPWLD